MVQKKIGNDCEKECLICLSNNGYWCHLFSYNANGQPCDIIAIKNNKATLLDVKHCDGDRFEFKRVEPNQRSCFKYAHMCGNTRCGFAIYFEASKVWKILTYEQLIEFEKQGMKSVKSDQLHYIESMMV